ncbi:hypothetical protein [Streptomyces celluloflavus]|uniref:hypothetical protein n=1 Tax=Streptomyces celluloflavus TaxID=58344 RepID=UPI00365EB825
MTPAAALAVVRAAVEDAQRLGLDAPQDVTEQVVGELTAHGWTITLDSAEDTRAAVA